MAAVDLTFEGAQVLRPEGLVDTALSISEGVIADAPVGRRIDARGFRLLPGIIDLHGDAFEKHLAPRRGAMTDMRAGMAATQIDLITCGITTGVLAQFYSWEGGLRAPEFARKMLAALDASAPDLMIDMRVQLRIETHMLDDFDDILALIEAHGIGYAVFNDHIPHRRLEEGRKPPRLVGTALKSGRSPEAHLALMQALHARSGDVPGALAAFSPKLAALGCVLGSHDDATAEDRAEMCALGCSVAEFPETLEAAKAARADGGAIVLGAPNVMRGGSHKDNASAQELIAAGLCDALASDYHYAALRQAIAALVARDVCGFEQAWALVSSGPAAVLGLTDRGVLAPGKRADILIEERETGRIAGVIAAGQIAHLQGTLAARMLS